MGNKERQAGMVTRQEKKKALWRQLQEAESCRDLSQGLQVYIPSPEQTASGALLRD